MTDTTSGVQVASATAVPEVVAQGEFRIVARNVNFFEGATTFEAEGQNVGFDRRVRVPLGQLYVFPDGVIDNLGHNEVYFGGEIVYVSKDKQDRNRKIYKLNQYGAQYVVSGQRTIPGISATQTDVATAQMRLTIEIHNPRLLLEMYPSRKNADLQELLDRVIGNYVNETVWSIYPGRYLEQMIDAVNPILDGNGIRVVVSNIALTRTLPRQVDEIIKECRLAEHRIVDKMDGGRFENQFDVALNQSRIEVLKKDPNNMQLSPDELPDQALLNVGDITEFVNRVTMPQQIQGMAFFELVMHKLQAVDTDAAKLERFVGLYAGPQLSFFVRRMTQRIELLGNATAIDFSVSVLRNSFN